MVWSANILGVKLGMKVSRIKVLAGCVCDFGH